MRGRVYFIFGSLLVAAVAAGLVGSRDKARAQPQPPAAESKNDAQPGGRTGRQADEAAIRKQSQAFTEAFDKGDTTAIGGLCTANCEYYDDNSGEVFRGRPAVEKSFAELFTQHPQSKVQVNIRSIRFLGRDTAVENGLVQLQLPGPTLPSSSHYRVLHIREDGRWYVAMIEERGADEDKLDDLGWLVGTWLMRSKDREARLTVGWNEKKTRLVCHIARKEGGRFVSSSTQMIGRDPQRDQLRSWNFDDEGGHGQALWSRDGHAWVQDAVGVLPDGTPTAATNILTRVSDDEFTWRSVGRVVGGEKVPDTDVMKATRMKSGN